MAIPELARLLGFYPFPRTIELKVVHPVAA